MYVLEAAINMGRRRYTGRLLEWTRHLRPRCKLDLEIVKRNDPEKTFRL